MKDPHKLWIDLAYRFAKQSHCKSRRVGAIIVKDGRLISQGWNDPPSKTSVEDCIRCKDANHESGTIMGTCICAHAEVNAIANAADLGVSTHGGIMYCTNKPCSECAKLICRAGIVAVYYFEDYNSLYTDLFFGNAGIMYEKLDGELL